MLRVPLYDTGQTTGESSPRYEKLLSYPFCACRDLGELYGQGIFPVIME